MPERKRKKEQDCERAVPTGRERQGQAAGGRSLEAEARSGFSVPRFPALSCAVIMEPTGAGCGGTVLRSVRHQ